MLKVLDLFSGIGGFSLGLERTGHFKTVAFCEIEPFPQAVLKKHWPEVPIYDDVRTLTAKRLRADGIAVDVITGGFPCQDISVAGQQAGIEGERSGLWSECARLISELRPRYALYENVTNLLSGENGAWFCKVLSDLASIGYDAEWHCIRACSVGLPHKRDRVWILAYPAKVGRNVSKDKTPPLLGKRGLSNQIQPEHRWKREDSGHSMERVGWSVEPSVCGSHDGLPFDMDRIGALGNAVVPQIPQIIGEAIARAEGLV